MKNPKQGVITGADIQVFRESIRETQQSLATRLNMSMSAVYKWETGRQPSLEYLLKLVELARDTESEARFIDAVLEAGAVSPETWQRIAARSRRKK